MDIEKLIQQCFGIKVVRGREAIDAHRLNVADLQFALNAAYNTGVYEGRRQQQSTSKLDARD